MRTGRTLPALDDVERRLGRRSVVALEQLHAGLVEELQLAHVYIAHLEGRLSDLERAFLDGR